MIAGMLSLERANVDAAAAERMAASEDSYCSPEGRCALSGPVLSNETHDVWMVLDGTILNHRALRHSLELVGHRFRFGSDGEAALHAYEQWGLDFLCHLQGAFALAIWDDRRDRLVLARDRLGKKPLFVAEHRGRLGFCSALAPLADGLGLKRRLNPDGLTAWLALGCVPAPLSLGAGMDKLAAGQMLVADRSAPPRLLWWGGPEPDERRAAQVRALPVDRHAGNLRTLLECAIADRVQGEATGIWLTASPGAGAVAAVLNRLTGRVPVAVAVGEGSAELRHLADHAHAELVLRPLDEAQAEASLPELAASLSEPCPDPAALAALHAARAGAEAGLATLLADTGCEEVLLSHPAYDWARRRSLLARLSRLMPRGWRPAARGPAPGPHAPPPPSWMRDDSLAVLGFRDLRLRLSDGLAPALAGAAGEVPVLLPFLDESLLNYALAVPGPNRAPDATGLRRILGDLVPVQSLLRPRRPALPVEGWMAGRLGARCEELLRTSPLCDLLPAQASWALLMLLEWTRAHGFEDVAEPDSAIIAAHPLSRHSRESGNPSDTARAGFPLSRE